MKTLIIGFIVSMLLFFIIVCRLSVLSKSENEIMQKECFIKDLICECRFNKSYLDNPRVDAVIEKLYNKYRYNFKRAVEVFKRWIKMYVI